MTEKPRHAAQNRLRPHMTNYWGTRILTQLRYLEELNAAGAELDELLDDLTAHIASYYDVEGAITKEAAQAVEEAMRPASALCKAVTVACVAHAHIDMNWMWRYDETAMLTVDTLRTMLQLMREYPDFTFAQSQASVYQIIERYAPEMLPEIRKRIREGRWEVTASTWVETDKNMPNGESLTRHLLYTRRYLKQLLGLDDDQFALDFEPDTFGHGANVPEILASGGVKYMYHCRGYGEHNLYRWRAPSGAAVTVYREPTWYNETITEESFMYVPAFCAKHGLDRLLHVYGVGDHGGGATRRDIERIMDYNTWPCMPTLVFGRYNDFFRYIETLDLPVVEQELNFIFDGCYTSQSRIKKANRVAEATLFDAELFDAAARVYGAQEDGADVNFAELWQNVLFNHFHDILPGSGTIDTREYALGLFQQTMAGAGTRLSAAARAIAARINTAALLPAEAPPNDSQAEGAGAGACLDAEDNTFNYTAASAVSGRKRLFVLFNPAQAPLAAATTLTVWDWDGDPRQLRITGEGGETIEHELLDDRQINFWGHRYFRAQIDCPLPSFGYRTVLLAEAAAFASAGQGSDPRVDTPENYVLENAFVKAAFDPQSAALVSFVDKESGQEYIGDQGGGMFRFIEEDPMHGMTAWRVGRHASDEPAAQKPRLHSVRGSLTRRFSFEATVRNSTLKVTVSLGKNDRHLQYAALCDWREFGVEGKTVPQLAFRAPLAYACERFTYDNAFGVIERAARDGDVPGQSFAFAPRARDGLLLSSDSKYGFRCAGGAMALTLIRSSYDPDPVPEIYQHTFNLSLGIVKDAAPQALLKTAQLYNRAAVTVACGSQAGELPLTGSFLRLNRGSAIISSIKTAADGGALIVRLYDVGGEDGEVTLSFGKAVQSAACVDAHENALAVLPEIRGNAVKIPCRAYGVTAVKVRF